MSEFPKPEDLSRRETITAAGVHAIIQHLNDTEPILIDLVGGLFVVRGEPDVAGQDLGPIEAAVQQIPEITDL